MQTRGRVTSATCGPCFHAILDSYNMQSYNMQFCSGCATHAIEPESDHLVANLACATYSCEPCESCVDDRISGTTDYFSIIFEYFVAVKHQRSAILTLHVLHGRAASACA